MPGKSAPSRKWIAGALHAARAAAFLTIATGVNGTLSAVWPHYEPIYAYLGAVVVVAFLSSALLGITAAVAAVILYDWMFSPVHVVPSLSIATPMAVAVMIAIATRAAVVIRERPVLAPPVSEPPLLPLTEPVAPVQRTMPLDVRIDDERVAALTQQLSMARSRFEDEARARSEMEAAGLARQAELEREVESLQARVVDQSNRSLASRREFDEMRERLKQAETRATALQQGLEAAQRRAGEEHARAARETTLREQLEVAGHESLQKAISDLSAKYETALLESKQRLEVATKRFENAQRELKDARAIGERESALRVRAETVGTGTLQKNLTEMSAKYEAANANAQKLTEAATAKINVLQRELDRTLASLSQEHNRADREARLRAQLEAAARETLHRTADVSASHQREALEARGLAQTAEERAMNAEQQTRAAEQRAAAAQEATRAADERARAAEGRVLALEQQFERLRFELSELRTSHDEKESLAASAEDRVFALQGEIDHLRGSHGEQLRDALETRASLEKELAATRRQIEEQALRDEIETAAHAKLAADHAAANNELQAVRAQRDAAAKSFDDKLRSIIDGINTDYESAIGEALIEKESVKAELRAVTKKMEEAQTLRNDLAAARNELEAFKAAVIEERQKANSAFDEKLQQVVAGISADYEKAIGDSLAEKEAAKAEMRTMTNRIQALQQKLDEEQRARERLEAEGREKAWRIVTSPAADSEAGSGRAISSNEAQETQTLREELAAARWELEALRTAAIEEREEANRAFDEKLQQVVAATSADYANRIEALQQKLDEEQRARERLDAESDEKAWKIVTSVAADSEAGSGKGTSNHETQETQTLRDELAAARRELEALRAAAIDEHQKGNRAFDEKLQQIVSGISADYENAIGDSLIEREAAKAEMRTMTKKIAELQQNLEEEKRLRERLDTEWGEKLQKIVTHLAEDHEADIGEAMLQKEAAKAELRTMAARNAALQQRLEEEREKFRQAAERWKEDRAGGAKRITPTVEQELPPPAPTPASVIPDRPVVVLVVHSDPGTRAMSKHSLQQAGYNVLTAADGLEGLRTATQYKPDVVLAQSIMPKMNARELVQLLKSRRETADVKVILLSNGSETERGSDFRADEVVRDSDDFNDVRAALASVLARRGVAPQGT